MERFASSRAVAEQETSAHPWDGFMKAVIFAFALSMCVNTIYVIIISVA